MNVKGFSIYNRFCATPIWRRIAQRNVFQFSYVEIDWRKKKQSANKRWMQKTVYYIIWCRVINPNAKNLSAPFHVSVVVNFATNIQKHFWFGAVLVRFFPIIRSFFCYDDVKTRPTNEKSENSSNEKRSNIEWTRSSGNNNDKCSSFRMQNKSPCGIIYYASYTVKIKTTTWWQQIIIQRDEQKSTRVGEKKMGAILLCANNIHLKHVTIINYLMHTESSVRLFAVRLFRPEKR